ncbi:MAG: HlyD family efflux transporter periplasmic adaptor subunit [Steroidobacteraceae bacterium]
MLKHTRVLGALALAGALMACSASDDQAVAVGTLERDRIDIVADSNEPIIAMNVREGDHVTAGMPLLQQDTARLDVALAQAVATRDAARARLTEAERGPRAKEIAQGRARLAQATSAAATAKSELDRERSLLAQRLTSANRLDQLQGNYEQARAQQREVQAALDILLEGTRSEVVDQARDDLAAAEAAAKLLAISVERATSRATRDGVVEALPYQVGERPTVGSPVARVLAADRIYARVHIPEIVRTRLSIGAVAEVTVDGHDDNYRGTIHWIASEASFTPYYALTEHDRGRLSYLAEIDLDPDVGANLPSGIPVQVHFPQP